MERNFNNEFERFLKENADQYRVYPSSKVWNGIYATLHTRRKWFGLGVVLLLITGSLVALLITHSSKDTIISTNKPVMATPEAPVSPQQLSVSKQTALVTRKNAPVDLVAVASYNSVVRAGIYSAPSIHLLNSVTDALTGGIDNASEPLNVAITDELTDQDVFTMLQPQRSGYPKSLTTSSPFDLTIESVLNSFHPLGRTKRFTLQLNITPTVSYRKLSENKSFLGSAASAPSSYPPLYDINSAVTHKPDLGLEFGLTSKYALATNFRVKAGLQFNINRYDIKAFNSSSEVAKIDLRGSRGVDSFYTMSSHRNFNGYKSDWLHNFYFEISMPVGAEINIIGDDKVQFGVAGTIQPTYVLGDRAYLLSTDYKNYAEVPWLIRRWNVNTGLETFVSYSTGKMRWQVGPQVRYQLLSSFIDKYPVKENLFDFGLKVGVSLSK